MMLMTMMVLMVLMLLMVMTMMMLLIMIIMRAIPVRRGGFDPQLPSSPPGCQGRPNNRNGYNYDENNENCNDNISDKVECKYSGLPRVCCCFLLFQGHNRPASPANIQICKYSKYDHGEEEGNMDLYEVIW